MSPDSQNHLSFNDYSFRELSRLMRADIEANLRREPHFLDESTVDYLMNTVSQCQERVLRSYYGGSTNQEDARLPTNSPFSTSESEILSRSSEDSTGPSRSASSIEALLQQQLSIEGRSENYSRPDASPGWYEDTPLPFLDSTYGSEPFCTCPGPCSCPSVTTSSQNSTSVHDSLRGLGMQDRYLGMPDHWDLNHFGQPDFSDFGE
jgi:hypothetical protein